jgi:hypothetical protein
VPRNCHQVPGSFAQLPRGLSFYSILPKEDFGWSADDGLHGTNALVG